LQPINIFDYEALAQQLLAPAIWDFYQGGSEDEVSLRINRSAWERIRLRPRMLVDVRQIEMRTSVLGTPVDMPILIAPTAAHALAHPEAECATAQGAGCAGSLMIVSTTATRTPEQVAESASGPLWFQLYTYRDLRVSEDLVKRAEAAGYRAIVFTVDVPTLGRRERDLRAGFDIGDHASLANWPAAAAEEENTPKRQIVDTWETVDWLRSLTKLPIILKGILTAEDALLALEHGVEGIIVSNHGGRQLDGALAGIEALPEVVEAVSGRCEVYVDGGIRRGTDVLKALALGARAVLVGRPIIWGLAVNGAEGVQHVLELLRRELEVSMMLAGRPTLASIDRSLAKIVSW